MECEKRILVVGMSPYRGGMESYIINLYREIVKRGYQFDFYVPHNSPKLSYEDEILRLGGHILRMAYGRTENMLLHWGNMKKALSMPNVLGVYINTCVLVDIDFVQMAEWMRKPIRVVHSHNSDYMSELSRINTFLEKRNKAAVGKITSDLFACSDVAGQWMFGRDEKYQIVHNGIDIEKYGYNGEVRDRIRKQLSLENRFVVGTVGRIQYQKNPEYIVEVFDRIRKKNDNAVLLWAGDGDVDEVQRIRKKIEQLGLSSEVLLLGSVSNVNELYQAMDVFLLPSRFEGLPFVLIEAQCAGLKCFVSDAVTSEADISGNITFLNIHEDAEVWADCIVSNTIEPRQDCTQMIASSGYDIRQTADMICKIFGEKGNNK